MDAMKLINNLCEGYNAAADEPAMQELKPLPCPLCGSKEPKVNRGCGVVTCCEISVEDVAAWNKLPRALRWTHEPPKVEGWYWCRECKSGVTLCVEVYGESSFLLFGSKRDDFNPQRPVTVDGIEWAGPIAPPID